MAKVSYASKSQSVLWYNFPGDRMKEEHFPLFPLMLSDFCPSIMDHLPWNNCDLFLSFLAYSRYFSTPLQHQGLFTLTDDIFNIHIESSDVKQSTSKSPGLSHLYLFYRRWIWSYRHVLTTEKYNGKFYICFSIKGLNDIWTTIICILKSGFWEIYIDLYH